jgi:2-iminobutanoate/2-iminopropanoate deaminase
MHRSCPNLAGTRRIRLPMPDVRARSGRGTGVAKTIVETANAPRGLAGYSQAVKAGGMVYVSGMGAVDPSTGQVIGDTIQEQTAQSLRNVQAALEAAGSSLDKVVWAIWSLRHPEDFDGFNEEWARWFTNDPPARHGTMMALPERLSAYRISIGVIAEAE